MTANGPVLAVINFTKEADPSAYTASLKLWLSDDIDFHPIEQAVFGDAMVLGVVEFDSEHCIYVLIPEEVFHREGVA